MAELRDDYKVAYIDSAATTQVDTGNGRLIRVIINEDAAGTINIIDGTSGSTTNIALLEASAPVGTYEFGILYAAGLRIITGAATKITVVYAPNN